MEVCDTSMQLPMVMAEEYRVTEDAEAANRYAMLKGLGKDLFRDVLDPSGNLRHGAEDIADQFIVRAARATNPVVHASWWDHYFVSARLSDALTESTDARFLTRIHEVGRLMTPGAYLRNDMVDHRLLLEWGIPKRLAQHLPQIERILDVGNRLNLTEEQLNLNAPFTAEQEKIATTYFDALSPTNRIIGLADNLGKRDQSGRIFDYDAFVAYLQRQEDRYDQASAWPSTAWAIPRRRAGAVLQTFIVKKSLEWIERQGIDFEKLRERQSSYGPKFVLVVRHGKFLNPKGIVYNRDAYMREEDWIHLSSDGEEQMRTLSRMLNERMFRIASIVTSPSSRAKESAAILAHAVNTEKVRESDDLDDGKCPGPYHMGMTMAELESKKGDVYSMGLVLETPEEIASRMEKEMSNIVQELKLGETGVIVSHGDPTAWLLRKLVSKHLPRPANLRNRLYLSKAGAYLFVLGPQDEIFTSYYLTGLGGEIY